MLWFVVCECTEDFFYGDNYYELYIKNKTKYNQIKDNFFITQNEMFKYGTYRNTIILFYFSLTTLSTIGLGDLKPVGDAERMMGAFLMFGGVVVFSYVMGSLNDSL